MLLPSPISSLWFPGPNLFSQVAVFSTRLEYVPVIRNIPCVSPLAAANATAIPGLHRNNLRPQRLPLNTDSRLSPVPSFSVISV